MAINVKGLLAQSMLDLIADIPLIKMSVSDICTRAGTVRQTFYNHFKDKQDLIFWIFLQTLKGDRHFVEVNQDYYAYMCSVYRNGQEKKVFFSQACKLAGQNCLYDAMNKQNYRYHRKYLVEHYDETIITKELEFALWFNAFGATNGYIQWVEQGMGGVADERAMYAVRCVPYELRKLLPFPEGSAAVSGTD